MKSIGFSETTVRDVRDGALQVELSVELADGSGAPESVHFVVTVPEGGKYAVARLREWALMRARAVIDEALVAAKK